MPLFFTFSFHFYKKKVQKVPRVRYKKAEISIWSDYGGGSIWR